MNIDRLVNNLKTITIDSFSLTPEFSTQVQINSQDVLGRGATSITYGLTNNHEVVVKVFRPCDIQSQLPIYKEICRQTYGDDQITRIPNDGKMMIRFANFLAEGIIGGVLNRLEDYTPHFIRTYGVYFSRFSGTAFTLLQRGERNWSSVIKSKGDAYLLLFQVAHALYTGQSWLRFTHYDLHSGNLLYVRSQYDNYEYHFDYFGETRTVFVPSRGFEAKIIDFGLSRLEDDEIIINLKNDRYPQLTYGVFNPFYDFVMLLGPDLYRRRTGLNQVLIKFLSYTDVANILSEIFDREIIGSPETFIKEIHQEFYNGDRPIEEIALIPPLDISGILDMLADRLLDNDMTTDMPSGSIRRTKPSPEPEIFRRTLRYEPDEQEIGPGMTMLSGTVNFPGRSFNYVPSGDKKADLQIFTIRLDQATGYNFKTVCCKMEPIEFMKDKFGLAINGGFFDVFDTYRPIGQYRQVTNSDQGYYFYETNLEIPELYRKYYGYLVIDDGRISIQRIDSNPYLMINAFISGPVLVWEGQPAFGPRDIERVEYIDGQPVKIFQCQLGSSEFIPAPDGGFTYSCERIIPGQLSHGGNPNPRSMLIIRDNIVQFVTVSGRTSTTQGADFLDLVELAMNMGASYAINLDGGSSVNVAFRNEDQPTTIFTSNRITSYPVGNILAFTSDK